MHAGAIRARHPGGCIDDKDAQIAAQQQQLELSTKCVPADAFQAAAETRAHLLSHGVDLEGEQGGKTRRALEFFSSRTPTAARRG